MINIYELS